LCLFLFHSIETTLRIRATPHISVIDDLDFAMHGAAMNGDMAFGAMPPSAPEPVAATSSLASVDQIRNVFPETWLWTNSSVGYCLTLINH